MVGFKSPNIYIYIYIQLYTYSNIYTILYYTIYIYILFYHQVYHIIQVINVVLKPMLTWRSAIEKPSLRGTAWNISWDQQHSNHPKGSIYLDVHPTCGWSKFFNAPQTASLTSRTRHLMAKRSHDFWCYPSLCHYFWRNIHFGWFFFIKSQCLGSKLIFWGRCTSQIQYSLVQSPS